MKKKSSVKPRGNQGSVREEGRRTIGMDLEDKHSRYCILDPRGEVHAEGSVATTKKALLQKFSGMPRCRVAMEAGTHSPWISRLLSGLGFEVVVANARKVRLISASSSKNDRLDARLLARLARVDPQLLAPIRHRREAAQADPMHIRVRALLVETRTCLINGPPCVSMRTRDRLVRMLTHSGSLRTQYVQTLRVQTILRMLHFHVAHPGAGRIWPCDALTAKSGGNDPRRTGTRVRFAPPAGRRCAELSLTPPRANPN